MANAKTKAPRAQQASDVKRLKFPQSIIQKTEMYLGERGEQMVFRCLKEIYDNSCDEHLAGRNNQIVVYANNDKSEYIVADLAGGIPIELDKVDKVSMLTLIFTELHTGGKFNADAYEASAGTHGVGAACVNAVSNEFEVWTFRDGKCYYQKFERGIAKGKLAAGKVTKDVITKIGYTPKKGTIVRFVPTPEVVSVDKGKTVAKLDLKYAADWLKNSAMFNKGLRVIYRPVVKGDIKEYEYINKVGLIEVVKKRLEELDCEASGKPIVFEEGNIRMCLQWSSYPEDDAFKTYVSCSPTRDHGTHEVGFRNALVKALGKYKKATHKFQPKDVYFGLVGIFDWRMSGAAFSSQVKDRLTSDVSKEVEEKLLPIFEAAFAKNKSLATSIIKRACDVKKMKEEVKKMMEGIAGVKRGRGASLPLELAVSSRATPDTRALYIVEGDSAGGTAKRARDSSYQEVLALSGKPPNAMTLPVHKLLGNRAVQNFLQAIGYAADAKSRDEILSKLRVKNIFILADADVDGAHINVLMCNLIYKFVPELIEQGRVFVVDAPLFNAYYKGKRYFGASFSECLASAPKGMPKDLIVRSKGWGEISAEVLGMVAFNPETRSVIQIKPVEGKRLDTYRRITGSESAAKRELLGI